MAILYVVSIVHPKSVSVLPPTITDSDWCKNRDQITKNFKKMLMVDPDIKNLANNTPYVDVRYQILFDNESELQSYISLMAIPDEIKTIINEWNTAHNISYTHKVYQLPEFETSINLNWI